MKPSKSFSSDEDCFYRRRRTAVHKDCPSMHDNEDFLKMKKDYIITFLTEFIVLASGILVYKLAANILGKEGFSEYALSRRTVSLIQPALLIGLGVGIPRYIAYASSSPNSKKPDAYFVGGLTTLVLVVLIFTFILNLFKNNLAFLIFGSSNYVYLMFPINLMLLGTILHAACYSYFRGKLLMFKANSLQFINMGIVPPFVFLIGKDIRQILSISGLLWVIISTIFLISIIKNLAFKDANIFSAAKELIFYGLQRVPGDFGIAALLTLPAIFTAHITGVREAGNVAFGVSILNMIGSIFAPIGLILLPKASQIIANKDFKLLGYYIRKILKTTFFLTALGVVFFEVFASEIINLYLGRTFSDLVLPTRIIMIAGLAYTVYVSMRSIIDAYYVKAINTLNIFLSLLLFLLLSGIVVLFIKNYIYIVCSFVIALFSLGSLTLLEIRKLLARKNNGI